MMGDDTGGHVPVFDAHGCREQAVDIRHPETRVGERGLRGVGLQLQCGAVGHAPDAAFADAGDGCFQVRHRRQSAIFTPRSKSREITMR